MDNFEKYEKEKGTSKMLNATAKEIQILFTKLEKENDELDSLRNPHPVGDNYVPLKLGRSNFRPVGDNFVPPSQGV